MSLLDRFFFDSIFEPIQRDIFVPRCDVVETHKEIILTFEIPGVSRSDVTVELNNGLLVIQGEKKQARIEYEKVQERIFGKILY
jgi:HSP20 family protein